MLSMTERAGGYLSQLLAEAEAPEDNCIRIGSKGDSLVMQFDKQEPGDTAYSHEGKIVLVIEEELAQSLDGRKIAVEETEGKPQLVLS